MTLKRLFTRSEPVLGGVNDELRALVQSAENARLAGRPLEAIQLYEDGLTRTRTARNEQGAEIFLGLLGSVYVEMGRSDEARTALDQAMDSAAKSGQAYRQARAMVNLGAYFIARGEFSPAKKTLEPAYEIARKSGDSLAAMLALANLSDVYSAQNNFTRALAVLQEANARFAQNPAHSAMLLGRTGDLYAKENDTERAIRAYVQAVEFAANGSVPHLEMQYAGTLAALYSGQGKTAEADRYYQRYAALGARGVIPAGTTAHGLGVQIKLNEAAALIRDGKHALAETAALAALESARSTDPKTGNARDEAAALVILAQVARAKGDPKTSEEYYQQAVTVFSGLPEPLQVDAATNSARIQALIALGSLVQERGNAEDAAALFEQALERAGTTDRIGRALALRQIGVTLAARKDSNGALSRYQEAYDLLEDESAYTHMARLMCDIAAVRRSLFGIKAAREDYENATILLNRTKDPVTRGLVFSNVANVYTDLGEVATAADFYQQAIRIARSTNSKSAEALRVGNYGWYHLQIGQPVQAERTIREALALSHDIGDPIMIAVQNSNLAQARHEQGDYQGAAALLRGAIETAEDLHQTRWIGVFKSNLGRALLALGDLDQAVPLLTDALTIARAEQDAETITRTLIRLSDVLLRQNRADQADAYAHEAETTARKWGYRRAYADALTARASALTAKDDIPEAARLTDEAAKIYAVFRSGVV